MPRILVIGEDETMQLLYSDALGEKGHDIIPNHASAGLSDIIERSGPDLVVLDENQRNRNGADLYGHICSYHPNLPSYSIYDYAEIFEGQFLEIVVLNAQGTPNEPAQKGNRPTACTRSPLPF